MVVQNQKTWENVDAPQDSQGSSASSSSSSWSFQAPVKTAAVRPAACTVQSRQPITRQIAINTLAAMHRRFSLPGPVQPHSRPIAEFRASANKSLDILRQTVQSAVTREIDQVIKKYLEKFFVPAVDNIRHNLGEESVSEDQVRAVCRHMLDATRLLYTTPPKIVLPPDNSDTKFPKLQATLQGSNKRKEADIDQPNSPKSKKIKQEDGSDVVIQMTSVPIYKDPKWNPARLTPDTLFIMGSHAHKVLGLGGGGLARGRLYSAHAGLPRYPADADDRDWIASHNLVNAQGGNTYIMVLEDIEELAASDAYRHNSLPMLGELTGFKVPPAMLNKIKDYVQKKALSGDISNPQSPQPSTSVEDNLHNEHSVYNIDANQILSNLTDDPNFENLPLIKDENDFADIKVDGIKVEDIDDIKVEGIKEEELEEIKEEDLEGLKVDEIKVEDLDVGSIKVENIDDINEEDINLENDDTLSVCKQTEEPELEGLLEADIEFLSRNLGNIESDADARKAIEKLTGANPDTMTLVGDEFDLGSTLNSNNFTESTNKCITVASTTSGMVHSVPVAALAPRPATLHYYTPRRAANTAPRATNNAPRATNTAPRATNTATRVTNTAPRAINTAPRVANATPVSVPNAPRAITIHGAEQVLRGIPINTKSGSFSNLLSQSTANIIGFTRAPGGAIIGAAQYVSVTSKPFPTGNILHNAIVSRNLVRSNSTPTTLTYNLTPARQVKNTPDYDTISTTKDMIDNACNSSVMLKKVLTLGSAGVAKSFLMHNSQKILSTGYATGSAPPNVTIVSSGTSGGGVVPHVTSHAATPTSLSATHATLSALLSSSADNAKCTQN